MSEIHELADRAYQALYTGNPDQALGLYQELSRAIPEEPLGYLGQALASAIKTRENPIAQSLMLLEQGCAKTPSEAYAAQTGLLLNFVSPELERSLLMYAADRLRVDEVRRLLNLGANVHMKNEKGETALFFVSAMPNREDDRPAAKAIAEMLLNAGADADIVNSDGVHLYNKATDLTIQRLIVRRFPKLEVGPVPQGASLPSHPLMPKIYMAIGAAVGLIIGLMAESLGLGIGMAIVLALCGLGCAIFTEIALANKPLNQMSRVWFALIFAVILAISILFVYANNDANFNFGNIFSSFSVSSSSGSASSGPEYGSYQGWGAGYNPLTGKVYD